MFQMTLGPILLKILRVGTVAMSVLGQVVYLVAKTAGGDLARITGRVIEAKADTAVVATRPDDALGVPNQVKTVTQKKKIEVAFLRVPAASLTTTRPESWRGSAPGDIPALNACQEAWKAVSAETLESSEADRPPEEKPVKKDAPARSSSLAADLGQLGEMFQKEMEETDSDSSGSDVDVLPKGRRKHCPPGGASGSAAEDRGRERRRKSNQQTDLLSTLLEKGIAEGKNPTDLMPYMMMSMLLDQQNRKKKKSRRRTNASLGGSSSEDGSGSQEEEKGMRAVHSLHKLQRRIQRHPKKIYMGWEKEIVEEMGIVSGQAWTIKDYLRKQSWGKFKGIYRCAMMDAQAYEYLRAGDVEASKAQLVQNMKAKVQSVIQQGDWSSAWLLTGLPDPLSRREFGGSKEEMAVVAEYINSLSKLRKKVKESGGGAEKEEE